MNSNNKIKNNEWYEIILVDGEECIGKCVQEPFFDKVDIVEKIRMSAWDNKKGKFFDYTIPAERIKSFKQLVTKKTVGDKIWEFRYCPDDNSEKFGVFCYSKFDADKIAKELISSKEIVKTFKDIKEAINFFNNQN